MWLVNGNAMRPDACPSLLLLLLLLLRGCLKTPQNVQHLQQELHGGATAGLRGAVQRRVPMLVSRLHLWSRQGWAFLIGLVSTHWRLFSQPVFGSLQGGSHLTVVAPPHVQS